MMNPVQSNDLMKFCTTSPSDKKYGPFSSANYIKSMVADTDGRL